MRGILIFIWEVSKIIIIALLIVIPVRYFIFQPFIVRGASMVPNFYNGDYLIVDELSYRIGEPERGDVVVFKYPNDPSQRYIKRIIGLPGETVVIKGGRVSILEDGEEVLILDESSYLPEDVSTSGGSKVILEEGEYFVLGDNRAASADSRRWGFLPEENIIGRVFLRAWPIGDFSKISSPEY